MASPALQPAAAACVTKVELHITCKGLENKDVLSKSDPLAVLYFHDGSRWIEHQRTERIKNELCPEFATPIVVDYYFEMVQKVKIAIYDIDNSTRRLDDDDFLGDIEVTLGQIVSAASYKSTLKNRSKRSCGTIIIRAEEVSNVNNGIVILRFKGESLDKKDTFGKSDPYLEISKMVSDELYSKIHKTEISCYDYDNNGSHDLIGRFTTTFQQMTTANQRPVKYECINPKKKVKKKSYKNSGIIILEKLELQIQYSFLEYIMGGCQINFTIGIDFTASNGALNDPNSLHFLGAGGRNQYVDALCAVGSICADYDTDKSFPAFGFGAKIPPSYVVSHEFPLNFNFSNPYVHGIQGVIDAYQNCVRHIQLYGPTNISPIIYHVAKFAANATNSEAAMNYFVLLLLTDGAITDMEETKKAIVYASKLPMSIIIVGIGHANFDAMEELDGDDGILRCNTGEAVTRDIVQFVPFANFVQASPQALAQHVLAEIPQQLVQHFSHNKIEPLQRK